MGCIIATTVVLVALIIVFNIPVSRVREGLYTSPVVSINVKISDVQYYNLVAILKDIEKRDPTLSNQFGIDAINLLNILDTKYTAILGDTGMLTHDKLIALMKLVRTNPPAVLPPFNISIKKYSDVSFGIHT